MHRAPPDPADLDVFLTPAHADLSREIAAGLAADDPRLHEPKNVARALADRKLFRLLMPPVSVRSLCLARESLAYVSPLADSVFAVQGLGSHPLVLADRKEHLEEIAEGKRVGAFALTEPEAGSDVASMRTVAKKDGAGWVLDGEKVFISNAGIATHYIVFANADPSLGKKGISAFFVPHDSPGLGIEPIPMSLDHPLGRVVMRGCRVPENALLGDIGKGMRLALGTLDVFRTSVGAAACGMARRALDESIAHVKAREQFGKKLAEFQLTQAALADMATELTAARLLVYRAAHAKDRGERATAEVAMAKMYATEAAQRIIDRAVQLHGGLGVTTSIVEQLYREIRPLRIYEGTTEIQKLILGGALVGT
jgi:acyl-CoA dehydrogenase